MRKLAGLRRRVTYANVTATVALFFALTGGATAAAKVLIATATIPATSDLAGSTYGNPMIASGKVTSGKIADGAITTAKFNASAIAPNADKLDGLDSSAFQYSPSTGLALAGNQFSVSTNYQLPQGCATGQFPSANGPNSGYACGTPTTYSGADFALSNQSCSAGQMVTAVSATGAIQCTTAPSGTVYGFAHVAVGANGGLVSGPGYQITVRCIANNQDIIVQNSGSSTLNQGMISFSANLSDVIYGFFPIPGNGGSLASNIHNSQGTVFLGREDGSTAVINVMEHDSADGSCNFWAAAQNKP